jgi:hypothetical protein
MFRTSKGGNDKCNSVGGSSETCTIKFAGELDVFYITIFAHDEFTNTTFSIESTDEYILDQS